MTIISVHPPTLVNQNPRRWPKTFHRRDPTYHAVNVPRVKVYLEERDPMDDNISIFIINRFNRFNTLRSL